MLQENTQRNVVQRVQPPESCRPPRTDHMELCRHPPFNTRFGTQSLAQRGTRDSGPGPRCFTITIGRKGNGSSPLAMTRQPVSPWVRWKFARSCLLSTGWPNADSAPRTSLAIAKTAKRERPLQNHYSRKNGKRPPMVSGLKAFEMWCGGGDLNPYGIAPASTSS